jgi:periplasmic copper chaperone A
VTALNFNVGAKRRWTMRRQQAGSRIARIMKNISGRMGAAIAAMVWLIAAVPAQADVVASEGWSRATVPGAKEAVGYLLLKNEGTEPRKLLRITSSVSDKVTLHQSSVDAQGMSRMWPLAGLELQPGEAVRFDPNGRHVMFADLQAPFTVGSKVPLKLQFDGGEKEIVVMLDVRPLVPAAPAANHSHRAH